jgi:hypothetical protein
MDNKIVMFNSEESAQFKTGISGWVSRNGRFYGNDERTARYDGCTHVACADCGNPAERGWLICKDCRQKRDIKKYQSMPKEEWNEEGCIYSDSHDQYFWSWDEVDDYCEDEEIKVEELRLTICVPQFKAMQEFNKVLKESAPLSWYPSQKAVLLVKKEAGNEN